MVDALDVGLWPTRDGSAPGLCREAVHIVAWQGSLTFARGATSRGPSSPEQANRFSKPFHQGSRSGVSQRLD